MFSITSYKYDMDPKAQGHSSDMSPSTGKKIEAKILNGITIPEPQKIVDSAAKSVHTNIVKIAFKKLSFCHHFYSLLL